ncbi:Hsp33 family molecular chaperone HslO [Exilibacterium tricleocarpae]|uniref:33 kDa chaperonin n=1 Tax=Exilibacterium tricleocarpae TaxID=2591008 RepID=A0A545TKB0_9GAMM|nr:Hsp33 family molecular chaperone HslO [Exilibacterium tricleocarpae]TQV77601.1 Hsp33 family molecular chaperone HslO [Exilibacterium tricleocarpae]
MPSRDQMHRFLFDHTDIRGEVVTLEHSLREVLNHNPLPTVVQNLLGQFLAAASLLSSTLKFDGILTLQARGEGPVSLLMAECTHHQNLRGIARLAADDGDLADLDTANIRQLLGKGVLAITIDPEQGERYQGIVPLDSDSLAGCLEHYFYQSEQLDTRLWLAADGQRASGLLLQALPRQVNASEEDNRRHWETACHLAGTVTTGELLELDHGDLLYRLFNEEQVRLFAPAPVRFACSCSPQRSANALKALGEAEARRILAERQAITIDCQFCNQRYRFGPPEVETLFGDQPRTLH